MLNKTFFNEFTVKLPVGAEKAVEDMAEHGILGGVPISRLLPGNEEFENHLLIAVTEANRAGDVDALIAALKEIV